MLDQYIEKMWFNQVKKLGTAKGSLAATASGDHGANSGTGADSVSPVVQAILKAQEKAVDNMDDFKFCVNIAVDKNNVERNPVNAANIWKYFDKEIVPAWKKLDARSQLVCRLDWYGALYRAVEEISHLPHAVNDRASVQFVKALGLEKHWEEAYEAYVQHPSSGVPQNSSADADSGPSVSVKSPVPASSRQNAGGQASDAFASFDAWLADFSQTVVAPQNHLWKRAEKIKGVQRAISRTIGLLLLAVVLYVAISYFSGYGYVAKRFGHEKMLAYATQERAETGIEGFGTFTPVPVSDYNASSIRTDENTEKENGLYSDRRLRDGDPQTAWEEGEDDAGINRRLYFNIKGSADVHYLVIWNGNQQDDDSFQACNRLKDVTIRINDRMHNYHVTLKDQSGPQYIRIERTDVDRLWIIINSVYSGTDDTDNTAVSEVEIY